MIGVVKFGNGYSVFDSLDSRLDFMVFTDGQAPRSSYKTMEFWDKYEDKVYKAIDNLKNGICPNCGCLLNVSQVFKAPCAKCRDKDFQVRKTMEKKYSYYQIPIKKRNLKWMIISADSIGIKLSRTLLEFNGNLIAYSFDWFFKQSEIGNGGSRLIRLKYGADYYSAELKSQAIFWDEKLSEVIREELVDLENSFIPFPDPRNVISEQRFMVFERTTDEDRYLIKFQKFTKVYSMVDTKKVQKKSDELDSNGQPISIEEYNERLREEIFKSGNTNKKERLARLKMAPRKPASFVAYSLQYKRNPDVIVEVLERAKGICEECGNPAPFIRTSDGTPYLEVHHIIPLSKDGEDTVENGVALCPNCHRKAHFGN